LARSTWRPAIVLTSAVCGNQIDARLARFVGELHGETALGVLFNGRLFGQPATMSFAMGRLDTYAGIHVRYSSGDRDVTSTAWPMRALARKPYARSRSDP
jgi:hypothetical protein